jgi:hypothetical protein
MEGLNELLPGEDALEKESLKTLLQCLKKGLPAMVTSLQSRLKKEQALFDKEMRRLNEKILAWESFEPKFKCCKLEHIKFNVGGTHFETSRENLTREEGTFFSILFSGRWEIKVNPKDDAIFIDRSPTLFGLVLDHLRGEDILFDAFTEIQYAKLKKEAEFYQIGSLLNLMDQPRWLASSSEDIILSKQNIEATCVSAADYHCKVMMSLPFELGISSVQEYKVRIDAGAGNKMMIGIAPKEHLNRPSKTYYNCGYFLNGRKLFPGGGRYLSECHEVGDVVSVILHANGDISFAVNEEEGAIAFKKAWNKTDVLYLTVLFNEEKSKVTLIK